MNTNRKQQTLKTRYNFFMNTTRKQKHLKQDRKIN